jgi:hypothetical protein
MFYDAAYHAAWYKVLDGTEATIISDAGSGNSNWLGIFRGCDPVTPVVASATFSSTSPDTSPFSLPVGPITTTRADTLLFATASLDGLSFTQVFTAPSGFSKIYEILNYSDFALYTKTQTSAGSSGTITSTATAPDNAGQMSILFGLQPPSDGGGGELDFHFTGDCKTNFSNNSSYRFETKQVGNVALLISTLSTKRNILESLV